MIAIRQNATESSHEFYMAKGMIALLEGNRETAPNLNQ